MDVRMVLAAAALLVVPGTASAAPDLRADTDRDGVVDVSGARDEPGEDVWTTARGALFLPNIDDDERRCRIGMGSRALYLSRLSVAVDRRLAACNDGADDRVNGAEDERDLAPVRLMPAPATPDGATGVVTLGGPRSAVRLFIRRDGAWRPVPVAGAALTTAELRAGAELAVEGRDVIRDNRIWDGIATVTATSGGASDTVVLRVAPVLLQNDLMPAVRVFAGAALPGLPAALANGPAGRAHGTFTRTLRDAARAEGLPVDALTVAGVADPWLQDVFEPAWTAVPGPDGPRTMRILLRAPNRPVPARFLGLSGGGLVTGRAATRFPFTLRGPDVGVVSWPRRGRVDARMDESLSSTGNLDALPPHPGHPNGRVLIGGTPERRVNGGFLRMLRDQGLQDPLVLDTSWLAVGHVDETVHVIAAPGPRGWTLMAADPRLAIRLLRDARRAGAGGARLFRGRTGLDGRPAAVTVRRLLADRGVMADSRRAALHIDGQLAALKAATGITDAEIVRVPVLYTGDAVPPDATAPAWMRRRLFTALSPGIVNALSVRPDAVIAQDPSGPVVGGRDVFRAATEEALGRAGVRVRWADAWGWLHIGEGEIHCGTNALRDLTAAAAWYERS